MKILKSKWYLLRLTNGAILQSAGAFDSESAARHSKFERRPNGDLATALKPGYDGVTEIRGDRLLERMKYGAGKILE